MKINAKKFRVKGEDILKKEIEAPKSINDFLNSEIDTLSSVFTQKNKTPLPFPDFFSDFSIQA